MKIVSTVSLGPQLRAIVERAAPGASIVDRQCRGNDEIVDLVRETGGCEVMFTFRVPPQAIGLAPQLRWVQLLSAGADHLPRAELGHKVAVTTASGIHAATMAEYTIASMLAFAHKLHTLIRAQMNREWRRSGEFMSTVDTMRGRTLGAVGYGSIGRETARIAQALGMRVLALKRDPAARADPGWMPAGLGDPDGHIPERFYGPGERREMLAECDYVTVTLPLTEATRSFIGPSELAAMRPHAYLVNVGRGEVIDQGALVEALRSGRLGGAGLDVFEREPLERESPLWEMENTILTPHMSGSFKGYVAAACELFAENLRRFIANQPLLNRIDPALGY
ncbi:MAG TPA: D-2-hydroxyacid dehydrogenase [Candidatus Binataceae bacterium]|jgi:phosphoglycerate dehydrogenase-like enzyme|nr:D-2-hydroxyacid dehydrogenase [Candidatus Binataceae bacterium]